MVPEIQVQRGQGVTRFYTKEEFAQLRKDYGKFRKLLDKICGGDCEDCHFSLPYVGCEILEFFDPLKNVKGVTNGK